MISVIIPTYNRETKLLMSVESVLSQTYRDIEIIIVDDGSTDHTEDAVRLLKDSRIRYIRHPRNLGACKARNTGVSNANGEYIAFQDSDDIWCADKLEVELNALLHNDADVVFCRMNKIVAGKAVGVIPGHCSEGFLRSGSSVYGIGTQTLVGKAEVFRENPFDERLPRYQDLELLIRLSEKYRLYCCDRLLVDYYCDGSMSAMSGNPVKLLDACRILHNKYPDLRRNHGDTCYSIAGRLLFESYREELNKDQKSEMRRLAVIMDPGIKTIVKFLLISFGIYPLIKKQVKS